VSGLITPRHVLSSPSLHQQGCHAEATCPTSTRYRLDSNPVATPGTANSIFMGLMTTRRISFLHEVNRSSRQLESPRHRMGGHGFAGRGT